MLAKRFAVAHRWLLLSFVVLATAACRCSRSDGQALGPPPGATVAQARSCPIGVAGARVDAVDTPEGLALVFTAPVDRVEELRRRVHDVAHLYGAGAHKGLGHDGKHLGAQRHGLRLAELPPLEASVAEIDGGARLELVPRVPAQADDLRSRLRSRVAEVNAGPCD